MDAIPTDPLLDALPTGSLLISPSTVGDDGAHQDNVLLEQVKANLTLAPASALPITDEQKVEVRRVMLRAGYKGVTLHNTFTYSEGPDRWSGITGRVHDYTMKHGFTCDCSAFDTWLGFDATAWLKLGDFINGTNWTAGYTGTMVLHGERVSTPEPTDFVFYGSLSIPYHVAVYIGNGRVISMGRPGTPEIAAIGPATQYRRYIY